MAGVPEAGGRGRGRRKQPAAEAEPEAESDSSDPEPAEAVQPAPGQAPKRTGRQRKQLRSYAEDVAAGQGCGADSPEASPSS